MIAMIYNYWLKTNVLTLIKILSSLVEMRGGAMAGHGRRVAAGLRVGAPACSRKIC